MTYPSILRMVLVLAMWIAGTGWTTTAAEQPALTLDQALQRARAAITGRDSLERAGAYAVKSRGLGRMWRDPELRFMSGEREESTALVPEDDRGIRTSQAFGLRIFLPHPAEVSAQRRLGKNRAAYYQALESSWTWALESDVRKMYTEVAYRQLDLAAVTQLVDTRREAHTALKDAIEAGVAVAEDQLRSAGDLLAAHGDQQDAHHALRKAQLHLAALIADPNPDGLRVIPVSGTDQAFTWTVEELREKALVCHPDWRLLKLDIQESEGERSLARAQRWPWISHIQGSYGELDWDRDLDATDWEVQAGITLPLFSWISDPGADANEDVQALQAKRQETISRLDAELAVRLADYRAAAASLEDNQTLTGPLVAEIQLALDDPEPALLRDPRRRANLVEQVIEQERRELQLTYLRDSAMAELETLVGTALVVQPRF